MKKLILFFLFVQVTCTAFAQTCCLTNSLIINTGYNPITAGAVTPGCNGCTPAPDQHWYVYSVSSLLASDIAASFPVYTISTSNADVVVDAVWAPALTNSNYISPINSNNYTDSAVECCGFSAGDASCVFYREFTLCSAGCVTFNLQFSDDNWVTDVHVDGSTSFYSQTGDANAWVFSPPVTHTQCYLSAGTHRIYVTLNEDNGWLNGIGLDIVGTISSGGTPNIISEGSGCSPTWAWCTEPSITGPDSVCAGLTIALSDAYTGGAWSSSNITIATVGGSTGIVTGVSGGTDVISYTDLCGRVQTYTVTVNPTPEIAGITSLCSGTTTTLSAAPAGGTWISSYPSVASINATTGVLTAGTLSYAAITQINYMLPTGCAAAAIVTVYPQPIAIAPVTLCQGTTVTLSDAVIGGSWSSSDAGVANIGIYSAVVTGISGGVAIITYMMPAGCYTTTTVTVIPAPGPITGTTTVCAGSMTDLSDTTTGGTWTSGNITIATVVSASGVVTGVSAGTTIITYTAATGCFATTTVTVNALPASVTGTDSMCVGNMTILSDAISPGTWSSSNTTVATVGPTSGIVTGVTAGTASITYTLTDGCGAATATVTVKVDPLPDSIVGAMPVCAGSTITLSDDTPYGSWSSSYTTIATAGLGSGVVTGVNMGTTIITYSLPTGCFMTTSVIVNPIPGPVTGITQVCVNATTTLSDDVAGGIWTSSNTGVATIDGSSGVVTGVTAGTTTITYTLGTGCFITTTVTVNPVPGTITGMDTLCAGFATTLSDPAVGGVWTSSTTSVATIAGSSGVVTGLSAGTVIITYTLATGCYATTSVTVNPIPTITGSVGTCADSGIVLSSDITGGVWTSSNTTVATVNPVTGAGTGITAGSTVISYTLPTGCTAGLALTVSPVPVISGIDSLCVGSTVSLSDNVTGGVWTSSNTAVATIDPGSGVVTGVMTGSSAITYTAGGCLATYTVTVDTALFFDMGASGTIYPGCADTISGNVTPVGDTTGSLMWSSSNTSVATVSPVYSYMTVITMAGDTGTAIITLTGTNACGVFTGSFTVTADTLPVLGISGPDTICAGSDIVLSSAPYGGYWTSGNLSVATVGFSSGDVTGVNPGGTDTITYNYGAGSCLLTATTTVTVNPGAPPITGDFFICTAGGTTQLSDGMAGGVWTSSNTGVATVDPVSGVVTDVSATGTSVISYSAADGCAPATAVVTVLAAAPACVCSYAGQAVYSFTGLDAALTGTLTTSPAAGGHYYLNHDIEIDGSINITNCVVVISEGVTITVKSGAVLTLTHSHLYSCYPNMWQGIVLSNTTPAGAGGQPTGQLFIGNNQLGSTLIEDAKIAVLILNPVNMAGYVTTGTGTSLLTLYVQAGTFNKDSIGIGLGYSTASYPITGEPLRLHPSYPFVILNSVFTCRNFYGFDTGTGSTLSSWPFVWPDNTVGTGALKTIVATATPYEPPYNLCTAYAATVCNNGLLSAAGIGIEDMGTTATTTITGIYSGVVVGGPDPAYPSGTLADDRNLFDNMSFGIYALNSNVVCRNSAFMNMYDTIAGGGQGIFATRNSDATYGCPAGALYELDVFGNASGYNNQFYNCVTDVYANDLYYVRGIYSQMSSAHRSNALGSAQGKFGYKVDVTDYYNVELNHNTISNITTGIHAYVVTPACETGTIQVGQISVNENTINAHAGGGATTPYHEYVHLGIDVEASVYPLSGGSYVTGSDINTDTNTIGYVYNGIVLDNFAGDYQDRTSILNVIHIVPDVTTTSYYEQAGIWHANNTRGWITDNIIDGPGAHVPAPPAPYYTPTVTTTQTVIEGIHCAAENEANVCGNTTEKINTGIFFGGSQNISAWTNNKMENNAFGYILDGGPIGAQPVTYGMWPANVTNNQWLGTWTGTNWQTYTIGSPDLTIATGSPMSVENIALENPTNNSADGPAPLFVDIYGPFPQGISADLTGTLTTEDCDIPRATSVPALYAAIARKQTNYVANAQNKNWIAQMSVWRQIAADTTVDTSAVLYSFKTMAASSRYKNLMDIEQNIATGNYAAANTLLANPIGYMASADSSATTGAAMADSDGYSVVANYRACYQLMVKYATDTLSSSDSAQLTALATMCPYVDGSIIYNARALYNVVFNDGRVFNDVGCEPTDGGDSRVRQTGDSTSGNSRGSAKLSMTDLQNQQYTLSPNPSDGNITLKQSVVDNNPVMAEIWNSTGEAIYNGQLQFERGIDHLSVANAMPGMYLLQLIDSGGNRFLLKFVISEK